MGPEGLVNQTESPWPVSRSGVGRKLAGASAPAGSVIGEVCFFLCAAKASGTVWMRRCLPSVFHSLWFKLVQCSVRVCVCVHACVFADLSLFHFGSLVRKYVQELWFWCKLIPCSFRNPLALVHAPIRLLILGLLWGSTN